MFVKFKITAIRYNESEGYNKIQYRTFHFIYTTEVKWIHFTECEDFSNIQHSTFLFLYTIETRAKLDSEREGSSKLQFSTFRIMYTIVITAILYNERKVPVKYSKVHFSFVHWYNKQISIVKGELRWHRIHYNNFCLSFK
jgi:hypothetical protein